MKMFFWLLGIGFFYQGLTGVDVLSKGGVISLSILFLKFIAVYLLFLLIYFLFLLIVAVAIALFQIKNEKKKESLSSLYRKATKKIN